MMFGNASSNKYLESKKVKKKNRNLKEMSNLKGRKMVIEKT